MKFIFSYQKPLIIVAIIAFMSGNFVWADTASDIQDLQKQIEEYQRQIDQVHSQSVTLQGQVTALNAQIAQITLELRSLQLSINQTNADIKTTQSKITDAETQISKDQVLLGQYLLLTYQNDQESLTNILLKNNTLSDFFNDVNTIATNQNDLKDTIENIKDVKTSLDTQEQQLEAQKADLEQQQQLVNIDKRSLDQSKAEKNSLLNQSKGQESSLQSKVDQLKQEIYYLQQNGVSVDDAIKYGNLAAISVGIRPAFLLAELNLESGLGQNVGKCKLVNTSSGASRNINTGTISQNGMNPTRDLPIFLQITSQLGRNPLDSLISCWPGYGWGGAMGPAQFIASTWVGYADRVTAITGHSPADPWNIQDAFTAAAIKFAKDGATSKTAAGEIAASKAYFCGNPRSTNSKCVNYANAVQRLESQIAQNL